jgi:hypothetical protein
MSKYGSIDDNVPKSRNSLTLTIFTELLSARDLEHLIHMNSAAIRPLHGPYKALCSAHLTFLRIKRKLSARSHR